MPRATGTPGCTIRHAGPRRLAITVIDHEADRKCEALTCAILNWRHVRDLIPAKMNVRWPEFYEGAFLAGSVVARL